MATPPPGAMRARTPPTPLHGPQYDNYEPYSPRRSKRSTAQSNPYSSFNGERSPKANITPPTTAKRARFSRAPPQLSSPPSSPASPVKRHTLHKTPRKANPGRAANGALSDSDGPAHSLAPSTIDPTTMLPTPSKTPKKRPATAVTARILSFQPGSPGDVMPASRKIKKQISRSHVAGFELYDDRLVGRSDEIEIYTDPNARVPEMDESEDNPFVGTKKVNMRSQRRCNKKTAEQLERAQLMDEAVRRGEGVTYVFRGRTIFRKFEEEDQVNGASTAEPDLSSTAEQRMLRHSAGAAAQRPLTRSAIKPRLLFPSEEQRLERHRQEQEADEEAVTDIEMSNANSPTSAHVSERVVTPIQDRFTAVTPPPTTRARRSKKSQSEGELPIQSPPEQDTNCVPAMVNGTTGDNVKSKSRIMLETYPRSKAGVGRKRANEAADEGASHGKRSRSHVVESP